VKVRSRKKVLKGLKKPSRKKLIAECDKLLSKWASLSLGPACATCKRAGSQAAHYFGKGGHPSVRYVQDNILWQCMYCHIIVFHRRADTEHAREALIKRIGIERFEALQQEAHKSCKLSLTDLESIRDRLQEHIDNH
jgi:hypothetical protein